MSVTLPSGAMLVITPSPFAVSKTLYQAILEEAKGLTINSSEEISNLMKNVMCTALSSKKIEAAFNECLKRVTYNGLKIDDQTFEPEAARGDYMSVFMEVVKVNIGPFTKNLYAQFAQVMELLEKAQSPA